MGLDYQQFAEAAQLELKNNAAEWEQDYQRYIGKINNATQKNDDRSFKPFKVRKPLYRYTTISNEGTGIITILRYKGQEVARIKPSATKVEVIISDKLPDSNKQFSKDGISAPPLITTEGSFLWDSDSGTEFRRFFGALPDKNNSNREHTLESALLTELEKRHSKDKSLCGIQPIKLNDKRFQMKTHFKASDAKKGAVTYSRSGGGIDILARRKIGNQTYLAIIELKDENETTESPEKAIKQAIAYTVFIRELLRSEAAQNQKWYHLFGFRGELPKSLTLKCAIAMPDVADVNVFQGEVLHLGDDTIELHCLCVNKENGQITSASAGF